MCGSLCYPQKVCPLTTQGKKGPANAAASPAAASPVAPVLLSRGQEMVAQLCFQWLLSGYMVRVRTIKNLSYEVFLSFSFYSMCFYPLSSLYIGVRNPLLVIMFQISPWLANSFLTLYKVIFCYAVFFSSSQMYWSFLLLWPQKCKSWKVVVSTEVTGNLCFPLILACLLSVT